MSQEAGEQEPKSAVRKSKVFRLAEWAEVYMFDSLRKMDPDEGCVVGPRGYDDRFVFVDKDFDTPVSYISSIKDRKKIMKAIRGLEKGTFFYINPDKEVVPYMGLEENSEFQQENADPRTEETAVNAEQGNVKSPTKKTAVQGEIKQENAARPTKTTTAKGEAPRCKRKGDLPLQNKRKSVSDVDGKRQKTQAKKATLPQDVSIGATGETKGAISKTKKTGGTIKVLRKKTLQRSTRRASAEVPMLPAPRRLTRSKSLPPKTPRREALASIIVLRGTPLRPRRTRQSASLLNPRRTSLCPGRTRQPTSLSSPLLMIPRSKSFSLRITRQMGSASNLTGLVLLQPKVSSRRPRRSLRTLRQRTPIYEKTKQRDSAVAS